ncbi:Fur family transcriptional regulator [Paenibacillus sp. NPDC056579]|uniref:Fur family transcriptional regulator n=1 Tax=Paenibacillus sp. NPDC056579 TaxID=3345871 RepID=UPI003681E2EA
MSTAEAFQSKQSLSLKIEKGGSRLTKQRAAILDVFIDKGSGLLTAEEVYLTAKRKYPGIGIATVYRTLDMFVELRLLRRIYNDRVARYCLCPYEIGVTIPIKSKRE